MLNTDFNPDAVLFNSNDPKQELGTEPEIKSDHTLIENPKKTPPTVMVEIARILLEFEIEQQYKAKLIAQGITNESGKIECIWSGNRITGYKILDQTIPQRTSHQSGLATAAIIKRPKLVVTETGSVGGSIGGFL